MKKISLLILFFSLLLCGKAFCQNIQSLDTIRPVGDYENIYTRPIYSDSLSSSFVIFIKKEVKLHKHITHTEQVYILDGEGQMQVGDTYIKVKKGDMIFIPKNTPHSLKVISAIPVKALSVQAPFFDGKDRVMLEGIVPHNSK
jgi:mannose-6-phosphate isomerase-like protein (cupin superfamily)